MKVKLHLIFFMVVKFSLSLKIEGKMKQINQKKLNSKQKENNLMRLIIQNKNVN